MKIENIYSSNTITFARSLLALCFLSTLIFSSFDDLFPYHHIKILSESTNSLSKFNLFIIFDNIKIPYFISILTYILVIFGIYPRYTCLLQTWISYSLYYTMLIIEGGDQINIIITILLIPVCILDNRANGWKNTSRINYYNNWILLYNSHIALIFIQIQVALLYFNAGVSKMFNEGWLNGTAIYYYFNDGTFGAPKWFNYAFGFLLKNDYTVTFITWFVMILEISLFVGLFLNQKKKYFLFIIGFIFHFLIFIVHGLPTFGLSMTACLILLFFKLDISLYKNFNLIKKILKNEIIKLTSLKLDRQ